MRTTAATIRERLAQHHRVREAIRAYFVDEGFLEVDTPVAVTAPAPEVHVDPVPVAFRTPDGSIRRFLQTSPELAMKRLLARGSGPIFQLCPVFRDGDVSPLHTPEFRLLEWYRPNAAWERLMDDCEGLIVRACEALERPLDPSRGLDLRPPYPRATVDELFRRHAGFSILDALAWESLLRRVEALGLPCGRDDAWDELFHRVWLNRIEPALASSPRPLFVTHFPAPLAALARISPDDPRVAERVELVVAGIELGNGFGELVDPVEQERRFVQERDVRRRRGKIVAPLDRAFLEELSVCPPSCGMALGFERLLMVLSGARSIDEIAVLPWGAS